MNKTIERVNEMHNINIEYVEPTLENIIESDKQIIILYHWSERKRRESGEHYALIDGMEDNKVKIVNYSFEESIKYISIKELKTMLLHYKRDNGDNIPRSWKIL